MISLVVGAGRKLRERLEVLSLGRGPDGLVGCVLGSVDGHASPLVVALVHINEDFARDTSFKGRIAHGMLTVSVISATIAGRLPGPGTVYLSQNLRFKAPVRPGDTVCAKVTLGPRARLSEFSLEPTSVSGDKQLCSGFGRWRPHSELGLEHVAVIRATATCRF